MAKLFLRAAAWCTIVRAAYPGERLRYRTALGAYIAGVGVNSIVPARGGDVVKMYLVKHRMPGSTYATLAPTLLVETLFDFFIAGALIIWALAIGVLPTHQVYSRIPTVDWKFFLRHPRPTEIALAVLLVALAIGFVWARRRYDEFRTHVRQGFAILGQRRRLAVGVILPQAISWVLPHRSRSTSSSRRSGCTASFHNALLAQVVDSLATLFPATPGGAGTKQGLIVFLFRGQGVSTLAPARVQRRHEHRTRRRERPVGPDRDRADGPDAVVQAVALERPQRRAAGVVPYASVYPLVTARAVAREFTYEVPEGVEVGAIVRVPFGRARARGIVVSLHDAAPEGVDARPIEAVIGEIPATLVELALWIADYYGSTPARALALVAPETPKRRKEQAPPAERQALTGEDEPLQLSDSQIAAVDRIVNGDGNFLLYGATGSGKTEVYLQACASVLERGFGAIVLVPEIALAPQTVGRVRARFGDRVAILHSALTDAERRDERARIASGEARIVVGARSAIFAPIRGLGLIVVDEEHDPSYKQDSDPRYDARTVAAKRAALEGAVAVFGSATPRPESWAALEHLELGGRIGADLPPVRVVDLRREAGYPLSAPLLRALRAVAEHRGKAILLLNRRGVAPALHCRACGTTIRCPNCDVSLVLHGDTSLRCHHCGYERPAPSTCEACGSPELARLGAGTQKLERELARELPELELIRLDADAVAKPEQLASSLARFRDAEGAVLLGTQMVAKGHHFAGVELAAVVDADTGARDARLSRGGENVPADHAAGRAQRPGRAGTGARPVVPARCAADRLRGATRRRAVPHGGARAAQGARVSAVLAPRADRRGRARARAGDPRARRAEGGDHRCRPARAGRAAAPPGQVPGAARGEDVAAAPHRVASRAAPGRRGPEHAQGEADRGRRRRPPVALTDMPHPDGQAHYPVAATG